MSRDRNTLPAMIRAAMPILCVAVSRTAYPYDWRPKSGRGFLENAFLPALYPFSASNGLLGVMG